MTLKPWCVKVELSYYSCKSKQIDIWPQLLIKSSPPLTLFQEGPVDQEKRVWLVRWQTLLVVKSFHWRATINLNKWRILSTMTSALLIWLYYQKYASFMLLVFLSIYVFNIYKMWCIVFNGVAQHVSLFDWLLPSNISYLMVWVWNAWQPKPLSYAHG